MTFSNPTLNWSQWQRDVLQVLRIELHDVLHDIHLENVDWTTWQVLYEQGRTPRAAVARALERDL